MTTLDNTEIAGYIIASKWSVGKDSGKLRTAVAIALAESGGRTDAVSATGDYGLFQINKAAHPDLFTSHNWKDPAANVDMARIVYERAGNSFAPWSTYNAATGEVSGKDPSKTPVAPDGGPIVGGVADAANKVLTAPAKLAAGLLQDVFKYLSSAFLTIGAALLAGIMLILGVWFLVKNTPTGRTATKAAEALTVV